MKKPNFMCIGAPKCATTTLYDILKQHPDVYLSSFKEPHFFDIDKNYHKGYNWYLNEYFSTIENHKIIGEFTPSYFIVPKVAERVYNTLGNDLKLIVMLRNPLDRAYSQYLHAKRDLIEPLSFEEALETESERLISCSEKGDDISYVRFSYINGGMYSKHLKNWLEFFDINQIKIVFFEDFENNQKKVMEEITEFLDLEPYEFNTGLKSNVAAVPKYMFIKRILNNTFLRKIAKGLITSQKSRDKITNYLQRISNKPAKDSSLKSEMKIMQIKKYFLKDIKELEQLINCNLSRWYTEASK